MSPNVRPVAVAGWLLALALNAEALYVAPPEQFITNPNEVKVVLTVASGSLADAQAQLDAARSANPDAVIVLELHGTYTVTSAALRLPSKTCLLINGTIRAAVGATAPALVSITGQSRVSVAGGTLDGTGANLHGLQAIDSAK